MGQYHGHDKKNLKRLELHEGYVFEIRVKRRYEEEFFQKEAAEEVESVMEKTEK